MKQALFIAHYFPPIGGAGVQRSLKFVKYLPEFGITPVVVTGAGESTGWWSPTDQSMVQEVPQSAKVYRTSSVAVKVDSARSQSREQALLATGQLAARENGLDLILVSMSPFEDARVAAQLASQLRIPWIADLRDPWALDEFQVYRTRLHQWRERYRMRTAIRTASLIIMNTPEAAYCLRRNFPEWNERKVVVITNGYDAADYEEPIGTERTREFTIVHSGYLHTADGLHQRNHRLQYQILGRAAAGVQLLARSHFYLLRALERWSRDDARVRQNVKLLLLGQPSAADEEQVRQSTVASLVKFTGYVSHAESIEQVRRASLLFLPMHKLRHQRRAAIVPGKTYEYMASGVPILAAVPPGDARDFVIQCGTGLVCEPDDVPAMARILGAQFKSWLEGKATVRPAPSYALQFERRLLAEQLAAEMHALAAPGGVSEASQRAI